MAVGFVGLLVSLSAQLESPVALSDTICVLDLMRGMDGGRQILQADLWRMAVSKAQATGYQPDLALSRDGTLLFAISREAGAFADTLSVIDTQTGRQVDSQAFYHRLTYTARPNHRSLITSTDGRWLYVGIDDFTAPDKERNIPQVDRYKLAEYNIDSRTMASPVDVSDNCLGMDLVPRPGGLYVLCSSANVVHSFSSTSSGLASHKVFSVPANLHMLIGGVLTTADVTPVHPGLAVGIAAADGASLTVVTSYFRVIQMDGATGAISRFKQMRADLWTMNDCVASPDGSRLYFPAAPDTDYNRRPGVDRIIVLESRSLRELATFQATETFWNLNISKDGRFLYAVSAESRTVHVLDSYTGREMQKLMEVGFTPSKVVLSRF